MNYPNMQKGFVQIPVLITLFVGLIVLAGGGYLGVKQYQKQQEEEIVIQKQQQRIGVEKEKLDEAKKKEEEHQELVGVQQKALAFSQKQIELDTERALLEEERKKLEEQRLFNEIEQTRLADEKKLIEAQKAIDEANLTLKLAEAEALQQIQNDFGVVTAASNDISAELDINIDYLFQMGAIIISDENDSVYLGKIVNKYDSDSIFNRYGDYGSKYSSDSIWNKYGSYGGKYSSESPFNKYTSSPPEIHVNGTFWGTLSRNKYSSTNVVNPNDLLIYAYEKYDDDRFLDLLIK